MDAVLLCMKKRGIRFFKRIKFPNTNVIRFHKKENFLGLLYTRAREFDNVLIMAHGSNRAFLTTTIDLNNPYVSYITLADVNAFKNDFVFAVSCSTANEFGKKCIEEGAIAYLGYQVDFGYIFCSKSIHNHNTEVPKRISDAINTIIKHIFIEELSRAYEEFLQTPISVCTLKERFSFLLEKRVAELLTLSIEQFFSLYQVKLTAREVNVFVTDLVLQVLSYLDDILPHLICIGDENYISSSYIEHRKKRGITPLALVEELEANLSFQQLSNKEYKEYLRSMAREP